MKHLKMIVILSIIGAFGCASGPDYSKMTPMQIEAYELAQQRKKQRQRRQAYAIGNALNNWSNQMHRNQRRNRQMRRDSQIEQNSLLQRMNDSTNAHANDWQQFID